MNAWIQTGLTILTMLAGLVGLYVKLAARMTALETRWAERDRTAPDREELYLGRAEKRFEAFCRQECPRAGPVGSRPGMAAYPGPIAPDGG